MEKYNQRPSQIQRLGRDARSKTNSTYPMKKQQMANTGYSWERPPSTADGISKFHIPTSGQTS